jgi:hypothetical protein
MKTPTLLRFVRPLIALIIVVCSFGFLFYLCAWPIPEQNKDIIQVAAGLDLALLGLVGNYYYGSSKDKSDHEQAMRQPDTTVTTTTTNEKT